MNDQEMFDTAVKGVLQQRCKSSHGSLCVLRSRIGAKCAVGWLIADEDYHKEMEADSSIFDNFSDFDTDKFNTRSVRKFISTDLGAAVSKTVGEVTVRKLNIMNKLQQAHDESDYIEEMIEEFRQVAKDLRLNQNAIREHLKSEAK